MEVPVQERDGRDQALLAAVGEGEAIGVHPVGQGHVQGIEVDAVGDEGERIEVGRGVRPACRRPGPGEEGHRGAGWRSTRLVTQPAMARARSSYLSTLPVALSGSSSTTTTRLGAL